MLRYLALSWNEADAAQCTAARSLRSRIEEQLPQFRTVATGQSFCALADSTSVGISEFYALKANRGVVLGRLFHRTTDAGEPSRRVRFDDRAADDLVSSRGQHLLANFWGRYVALLFDSEARTLNIIRDPSGALPCFITEHDGVRIVFSSAEDLARLVNKRFSINWQYVAAALTGREIHSATTGVQEIQQVRPGERLSLHSGGIDRELAWNPMRISETSPVENMDDAVVEVRKTVDRCISSWGGCFPHVLLRNSGGFDSTVVLAALRHNRSRPPITCLNYFDAPADEGERQYLRRAINATASHEEDSVDALEIPRQPDRIRLDDLLGAQRYPTPRYFKWALMNEPDDAALARERNAAIFDGNHGDALFLTDTSHTALDQVWRNPAAPPVDAVATLWSAMHTAFHSNTLVPAAPIKLPPAEYPFIESAVLESIERTAEQHLRSYWRQHPTEGVAPGKLRHIAMMCLPDEMRWPWKPDEPDRVTPLMSQPLLELFLRIPTYVLNAGPLNRTVTRKAFDDRLPEELRVQSMVEVGRRSFNNADHLSVLKRNERLMWDLLLEGQLVKHGLLKRAALESYLLKCRNQAIYGDIEVLEDYFDLEVWLHSWK